MHIQVHRNKKMAINQRKTTQRKRGTKEVLRSSFTSQITLSVVTVIFVSLQQKLQFVCLFLLGFYFLSSVVFTM